MTEWLIPTDIKRQILTEIIERVEAADVEVTLVDGPEGVPMDALRQAFMQGYRFCNGIYRQLAFTPPSIPNDARELDE
jgi:hypothetical protein